MGAPWSMHGSPPELSRLAPWCVQASLWSIQVGPGSIQAPGLSRRAPGLSRSAPGLSSCLLKKTVTRCLNPLTTDLAEVMRWMRIFVAVGPEHTVFRVGQSLNKVQCPLLICNS